MLRWLSEEAAFASWMNRFLAPASAEVQVFTPVHDAHAAAPNVAGDSETSKRATNHGTQAEFAE
jgi:hypothetical protein